MARQQQNQFRRLDAINTRCLQPALRVGAANDPLEREAETTADRIVSMPAPEPASPVADPAPTGQGDAGQGNVAPGDVGQPGARRASADDQPDLDTLETAPPIPADHQDPEVPPEEDVDTAGLSAEDMAEIESGEPEDTAGEAAAEAPPPAEEPAAQPARSGDGAVVGAEGGAAPADVAQRVAQPGSGRPLPATVRGFMEPRFGKDFSDVRIHDAPQDRTAARRIGARAFTHRQHIWMGPGEAVEDRRLLAHELTHVVQQTKRSPVPSVKREVASSEDAGEPEVRRFPFADKAEEAARNIPGYRLVTFVLGKSPITDERVDRNATNLLGALLGMIPGGNLLFERLRETRVIEEAYTWISGRLGDLKITWARISRLISELADYLPALPWNAVSKAKSLFAPVVRDILTFIGEVKDKILEFIIRGALKLAGPLAERVWGVIKKAGAVISTILEDPLAFAKNLFKAVLQGFKQFGSNVLKHIKSGLLGWLFGTIQGLEITIPEKLDFKGLISIALQVVGLTYDNFRARLVKKLGANGERKVAFLEKSVEVVKILVKEGFAGLWQRVLQMIEGFKETVIGGIRDFVIKTLIMGGLSWLAGLSNPVGAVVKVVLAIYNIIKTFLERLDQILEVANSIFSSIGAIAAGNVKQAADFIEKTIAATIPVVISFLAALVPVSGIVSSIRNIIKKLRKPVDRAIDKMIGFVVKKAKKLFSKIVGKLNKKRKPPEAKFHVGTKSHRILIKKKGNRAEASVQSTPNTADNVRGELDNVIETFRTEGVQGEELTDVIAFVEAFDEQSGNVETALEDYDPVSRRRSQLRSINNIGRNVNQASAQLERFGLRLKGNTYVDENDPASLIRFNAEITTFEGQYGIHNNLSERKSAHAAEDIDKRVLELDHNPSTAIIDATRKHLEDNNSQGQNSPGEILFHPKGTGTREDPANGVFGRISVFSSSGAFPAMAIFGRYNAQLGSVDAEQGQAVTDHLNKNGLASKAAIRKFKTLLGGQIRKKLVQINKKYQSDPPPLKKVISQSTRTYIQFARDELNLSDRAGAQSEAAEDAYLRGNSRSFQFSGDPPQIDFTKNEGKSGTHNSLSGRSTVRNFLEADHNPMRSEIKELRKLTLFKLWSGASPTNHPNIEQITQTTKRNRVRKDLAELAGETGLLSKNYEGDSEVGGGGAVTIAATINQHPSMKEPSDPWINEISNAARVPVRNFDYGPVIADLAANNTVAAREKYGGLAKRAAQSMHRPFEERIKARQRQIFDLYQREEAPRVFEINNQRDNGQKAVGLLATIAAKMKSSENTSKLVEYTRKQFPGS